MSLRKIGDLHSAAFLEFVRSLPCYFCGVTDQTVAHHAPPKGRLGYTDDSSTLSCCTFCHKRCHGETVNGRPPISEEDQKEAVMEIRVMFLEKASRKQFERFSRDRLGRVA